MSLVDLNALFYDAIRRVVREENERLLTRVAELVGDTQTPMSSESSPFMTVRQAAEFAAVTERTIRDWVRSGELPKFTAGRLLRVRAVDLEQYMSRCAGRSETPDRDATDDERVAEIMASVDRG